MMAVSDPGFEVKVQISNIQQTKGLINVCLVTEREDFLGKCSEYHRVMKVTASEMVIRFPNVPSGEYAITVVHDQNSNGKLDVNLFGIPSEPYGFSNNPSTIFGPPAFEKCVFSVSNDKSLKIKLK
ncbi:MAG: DUF2141 domain-containing protein [Fulvivirga sp.]|nr:DUF2141 domain-containing protein [Fulvivirga sp.]